MPYQEQKELPFSRHYTCQSNNVYYKTSHELDRLNWIFFEPLQKELTLFLGVGRGEILRKSSVWFGVDFNKSLVNLWKKLGVLPRMILSPIEDLNPELDGQFKYTASCDVLEHIEPSKVDIVLDKIAQLAPNGKHIIDTVPQSGFRGRDNFNLHCSANTVEWWTEKFKVRYGDAVTFSRIRQFLRIEWTT
jgi:hypothetical protein